VSAVAARLDAYYRLVRLDRPIGALLLLWPAMWSLWLAAYGVPHVKTLVIFVLGVFSPAGGLRGERLRGPRFRSARRAHAQPAARRRGDFAAWEAIAVAAALFAAAFCSFAVEPVTVLLSVAALVIAVIYPFSSGVFPFPQAWLGLAFGFSIPMAYAPRPSGVPDTAWVLLLANVYSGRLRTTPSTRWSTVTTTCASA